MKAQIGKREFCILAVVTVLIWGGNTERIFAKETPAPGRQMARQVTKARKLWNTTDHTKHDVLQGDFKSGPEITKACLSCHSEAANQFHQTIHWTWIDPNSKKDPITGKGGHSINNFCISTNSMKDKKCLSCHTGWNGKSAEVNCLVCHGQEDFSFKEAFGDLAFLNESNDEDSKALAQGVYADIRSAVQNISLPTRKNCGGCHFYGGGGDGVKHGDLDSSMIKPNKALDVHMGIDGQNFQCVRCHTTRLHQIAGRVYGTPAVSQRRTLIEDDLSPKIMCESCHSRKPHKVGHKANDHTDKVACQSCHIPRFARVNPTKMWWDWSKAGKKKDGKGYTEEGPLGKHSYMSIKGEMRWAKNVKPEYFWFNGALDTLTAKDVIDPADVVRVSWPEGSREEKNARIFPFKVHRGMGPYDKVNKTMLTPLLSGPDGFWTTLEWEGALKLGAKYLDLSYSGQLGFVETSYVFPTTHMVAPKENVVGCNECHNHTKSRLASLTGFYMPGRDRIKIVDFGGWAVILGSLGGVLLHGLGRFLANGRNRRDT
jgi:octaheme c-type cytochrome (tetrathionate reductase family)